MNLAELRELYGTVEKCFDVLLQWRQPNGYVCPFCGHDLYCVLNDRRMRHSATVAAEAGLGRAGGVV